MTRNEEIANKLREIADQIEKEDCIPQFMEVTYGGLPLMSEFRLKIDGLIIATEDLLNI